jgi:hypothetical protein
VTSQRELVRYRARQLGWQTIAIGLASSGAAAVAVAVSAPVVAAGLFFVGGAFTFSAGYRWLRYRGQNGLKF